MKKLLVIDGNNLAVRSYWAVQGLSTAAGENTNLIYGFFNALKSCVDLINPDKVIITWDLGGETFRHKYSRKKKEESIITKIYKESRIDPEKSGIKEDIITQMKKVRIGVEYLGLQQIGRRGVEADDIIGALAKRYKKNYKVVIYSGDKDFYQLISKNVQIYRNESDIWNLKRFKKEYGVKPKLWVDIGSLTGDGSDDIEGIRGLGPKRALDIIKEYGNLKDIIKNRKKYENKNVSKFLKVVIDVDNIEKVKVAYRLKKIRIKLKRMPNLEFVLDGIINIKKLKKYFRKYEIKNLNVMEFLNIFKRRINR